MLDPGAECPECGARLGASPGCKDCGWKPRPVSATPRVPEWTPPVYEDRGGKIDTAELRGLLHGLYEKFQQPLPDTGGRLGGKYAPQRCERCAQGNFKHNGVTYCLSCYQRL